MRRERRFQRTRDSGRRGRPRTIKPAFFTEAEIDLLDQAMEMIIPADRAFRRRACGQGRFLCGPAGFYWK